ncbi:hypothetical protein APE_2022 [Aeropyrum pernix K1]|uniref:Uncharacterized protein n=1 Tax=Aeropyrum pernix (strain ATCC 700893 / DSM 11879 / JCM 9820 / NBRC 100138 / K1) TaxID=272557 RepID=Q9YAB7_AERPE|nr:hypothetical protein [Aeropyrum pernix]BAA81032.1 hypothetical protein APE_2022 [Aeropyrum pernix K1]
MLEDELRRQMFDREQWRSYWELLARLYTRASGFLRLYRELRARLVGKSVEELLAGESESAKKMVLGGFKVDEQRYRHRALGIFTGEALGIRVSEEDLKKLSSRILGGAEPREAGRDIFILGEDSPVVDAVSSIASLLERLLRGRGYSVDQLAGAAEYDVEDPLSAVYALRDVLDSSKRLLPLYNPVSFMLNSFFSTPLYYLEDVYGFPLHRRGDTLIPADDEVRSVFEENGVRLRVILDPGGWGRRHETAIVGHEPGSTGFEVHRLTCLIYALHSYIATSEEGGEGVLKRFFRGVRNEYEYYIETYGPLLETTVNIGDVLRRLEPCSSDKTTICEKIHGTKVHCIYKLESCNIRRLVKSRIKDFHNLLLDVGLLSFLGLAVFNEEKVYFQQFTG